MIGFKFSVSDLQLAQKYFQAQVFERERIGKSETIFQKK